MDAEQRALLPCPFCGGDANYEHRGPGGTMSSGMEPHKQRIACAKCGAGLPWEHPKSEWGKQDKHDAALRESLSERWNTRALTQAQPGWRVVPVEPTPLKHAYKPHEDYPWFCDVCGYPEHEKLKHTTAAPAPQQGEG